MSVKKRYAVYYRCIKTCKYWGKEGDTKKIMFKNYSTKKFEDVKPANWKIEKVEVHYA